MIASVSERFDWIASDERPHRVGVLGGTFDPVHVGHLAMADAARIELGLDAVLFVPTAASAFKEGSVVASPEQRLSWCKAAVRDNAYFDVSGIDIERGGKTRTVDTLRDLRSFFGEHVRLFFIMGSDAARGLHRWSDAPALASLASFAVVPRAGHPFGSGEVSERGLDAFDFCLLDDEVLDVSSTVVRKRLASGSSVRYFVPSVVAELIECADPYRPTRQTRASDEVFGPAFERRIVSELERRVSERRLRHIRGVADMAERLAHVYGADPRRARLAGLLHDWDKGLDDEGARRRVFDLGLGIDGRMVFDMPALLHGPTAAEALRRAYPDIPDDVLQAVARHTAGAPRMSDLDMVVYVADAIEENRRFPGVQDLRDLIGEVSLEKLFFRTYRHILADLIARRKRIHPRTVEVWNSYVVDNRD
ncbi:nicotinate-nucleotide adenylyltransferase [Gordonibacter sp. Marseille-P4307]|uniref:nicotinate-nucleotide adenylyltransferase n=1 Tax=Gordonibacter sp. Marseille-P4307 TaxID=2161815 RepID=UPI000F52C98E|nr:nicotinate-nucleotide adenylyltransferase [Gordonibacter sp. Marseille-P4307]